MKKLCLSTTLVVFFFIGSNGIQAQNTDSKLDQLALSKQFIGNWQHNVGKDTVEFWKFQPYGKAFKYEDYLVIKGKKSPLGINNFIFDSELGKFKGFFLSSDGWCVTWFGSFITEKKNCVDIVQNFNPEIVNFKYEFVFETANSFTLTGLNKDGVKVWDAKFNKIK